MPGSSASAASVSAIGAAGDRSMRPSATARDSAWIAPTRARDAQRADRLRRGLGQRLGRREQVGQAVDRRRARCCQWLASAPPAGPPACRPRPR
jgi:hypothetical protein